MSLVEVKPQRIDKKNFVLPPTQVSLVEESLTDVLGGGGTRKASTMDSKEGKEKKGKKRKDGER